MYIEMQNKRSAPRSASLSGARSRYVPPKNISEISYNELFEYCGRPVGPTQEQLFAPRSLGDNVVYYSGDISLLLRPCVSVIGARSASDEALRRARKIAALLASAGVVVTSGLAKGIDAAAHTGALGENGKTVGVIGTPLERAYPIENAELQETIYRDHLLLSQFAPGSRTFPSDFPKRNRLMAAVTDASVIVEASDTSGTLHQATECIRLGRWLFIMKSVVDSPLLDWPQKFLKEERVAVLSTIEDVLSRVSK